MDKPTPIVLFGCGRMGSALLRGWLDAGVAAENITIVQPRPSAQLLDFADAAGLTINGPVVARPGQAIVLAVKPQKVSMLEEVLRRIVVDDTLVISIMAGKTAEHLRGLCGGSGAYVRAMPNLPASVGRGATVAFADPNCTAEHRRIVVDLLGGTGQLEWLEYETLIDAATGVSGSGPAYLFYMADCLTRAGVEAGLPAEVAERLARATVSGAGELLRLSPKSAGELRSDVTSPAGTTEAGLRVLMKDDQFQRMVNETVAAAVGRARELAE